MSSRDPLTGAFGINVTMTPNDPPIINAGSSLANNALGDVGGSTHDAGNGLILLNDGSGYIELQDGTGRILLNSD